MSNLYTETINLVSAILGGENAKARELMKSWPKNYFIDLLHIITQTISSITLEEYMFNDDISKAMMILSCKHPELEHVWNTAINDSVSIHFDEYKPFLTACQHGNLDMVKDFRRFQYDNEDGSNLIPDSIWIKGANLAKDAAETIVYDWIVKYIESGTDDEEDNEDDENSSVSSQSDDYNDCRGEDFDEDDDEEEEIKKYEETRKILKEKRAEERKNSLK